MAPDEVRYVGHTYGLKTGDRVRYSHHAGYPHDLYGLSLPSGWSIKGTVEMEQDEQEPIICKVRWDDGTCRGVNSGLLEKITVLDEIVMALDES